MRQSNASGAELSSEKHRTREFDGGPRQDGLWGGNQDTEIAGGNCRWNDRSRLRARRVVDDAGPTTRRRRLLTRSPQNVQRVRLLDDMVRPQQHRRRDGEAERPRGLKIDHVLERGGPFDGEVGRFGAFEESVDVRRQPAI